MTLTGWPPLAISLWVTAWAGTVALVVGTAVAWVLARVHFRGRAALEGLTLLPLVLPPTVLGYYLLVTLGQQGVGPLTERLFGFRFVFTWLGAVVAASITALPLVIQTARASLAAINREIEDAARVDGCNRRQLFWHITLPLAWRGVAAGGLMGYLRALGDFGATLMVAGNIPGRTQTLPMALYDAVQANDVQRANLWVLVLSAVAFSILGVVLKLNQRVADDNPAAE